MSKHSSLELQRLIKHLSKSGQFHIEMKRNNYIIKHISSNVMYIAHQDDKAYHPLRRFVEKCSNFNIKY